jgi:uncharacterized protein (TIGR04255 family)
MFAWNILLTMQFALDAQLSIKPMTTPSGVPQPPYKKPPIIEAVIAMHFAVPLEIKSIEAFALKRKARFPRREDMLEVKASFDTKAIRSASTMKKVGRRLHSSDDARVIVIMPAQLAVIQRAPYTDWDTLCGEAREHWKSLTKIVKRRDLSRVSARYVNRIDIPIAINGHVDLHKYFNIGLSLPQYAQAMALQMFHVNCSLLHASGQYRYTINVASTPSPLIDYMSFTIDIDIVTIGVVPQNEEKMWELIGSLRQLKNDLFESCITSETRKLFQ